MQSTSKFSNLRSLKIIDYLDKQDLIKLLEEDRFNLSLKAIFHQGACTDTSTIDYKYIISNNFTYSKFLLKYAINKQIPFIYASSASVYGKNPNTNEDPLNAYAYSKWLLDRYVYHFCRECSTTIVGLRYFNVYGLGEAHKGKMASTIYRFQEQLKRDGEICLFGASDGYASGSQRRDFVTVDDIVKVNLFFLESSPCKGTIDVGTGESRTFNDIAEQIIAYYGYGEIRYIPFPTELLPLYQSNTQAQLDKLRNHGYKQSFTPIEIGIPAYLRQLDAQRV